MPPCTLRDRRRSAVALFGSLILGSFLGANAPLHAQTPLTGDRARREAPGYAADVSGDYAVVGASWRAGFSGAAYVLKRDGGRWVRVQTLSPSDLGRYDRFGSSVAIDGDRLVVSAPWQDLLRGAVYVYHRRGEQWELQRKVTPADGAPEQRFGSVVGIDGDRLVVSGDGTPTARAFVRRGDAWVQEIGTAPAPVQDAGAGSIAAADVIREQFGAPPAARTVAVDPPAWVVATDGVFEDRTEITWARVDLDAILYKVTRDGVLLTVTSSEDSLYLDTSGARGVAYDYCVSIIDMLGDEGSAVCDAGSRIVYPARNVAASDGQFVDGVHLTWDDQSASEAGYYLTRDGSPIDTLAVNAQSAIDATAVATTVYDYAVIAFDAEGRESVAAGDDGFRGLVLPPLDVAATDGEFGNEVRLTWIDQSGGTDRFVIAREDLTTLITTVLDTTAAGAQDYSDATAQSGTRYDYCVTVLDPIGQLSVPVCDEGGVDLPPPANVAASDSTYDDRVELTWEDPSDLEDGFQILRDGLAIDTTLAGATSYKDYDAQAGVAHTYCVASLSNSGGLSAPACDDGFRSLVLAPASVKATDGTYENVVKITWESASTTAVLFKIYRDAAFIKSVSAGARAYNDAGGAPGVEYAYRVEAVTALLDAASSAPEPGHRELHVPAAVSASDESDEDRVVITWTDTSAFEDGFVVYRTDTATAGVDTVGEARANVVSFIDRTGVPGRAYRYGVAAFDTSGVARGESEPGEDLGRRALRMPTDVMATDGAFEDRVEITWADNSSVEDGYRIYRNGVAIHNTADNITSYIDTSPVLDTHSLYSVRAFDAYGTSKAASDSGFTTILSPASFNASDTYTDRVVLRWVDVSEIEAGYLLEVDSVGVVVRSAALPANSTSHEDPAGAVGVPYRYRLRAFVGSALSDAAEDVGVRFFEELDPSAVLLDEKLAAGDRAANDRFGSAVAALSDQVIVGSPTKLGGGAAYVYTLNPDLTWTQSQKLTGDDQQGGDQFGAAIAASGANAVIGLPNRQSDYQNEVGRSGIALIFRRGGSNGLWFEFDVLRPTGELPPDFLPEDGADRFGSAVAISGNVVVVGAPGDDTGAAPNQVRDIGSMYVFAKPEVGIGNWPLTGKFFAGDGAAFDEFGKSVAVSGDWIMVGAPGDDNQGARSGSVYFYKWSGSQWEEHSRVNGIGAGEGAGFGSAVALSGNVALAGAPHNLGQLDGPGSVHVFVLDASTDTWKETQQLVRGDAAPVIDGFGASVAIHGGRIIVGAAGVGDGSAHVFVQDRFGAWQPAAILLASDGETGDRFGSAVALGDEWAFAGASEDDEGTLVNIGSLYGLFFVADVTDVTASDGDFGDRVHITWQDRTLNEEGTIIYRDGVEYERLGPDATFYDDFGAEPGRTYEYQVAAINKFAGFAPERVPDYGWRPPNGHITGRITTALGSGVAGVNVCLEPAGTGALLFDGVGGQVRIADDGTFGFGIGDDFTVETWFSFSNTDRAPRILSKASNGKKQPVPFDVGLQRSGRLFFIMTDGVNVARALSASNSLADDTWHHVACVHDAALRQMSLYIDGVLEGTASTAALGEVANGSDIVLGGYDDVTRYGGQLDDIRIWDEVRSADQLATMRSTRLTGDEAGLVGYWPLDETGTGVMTDFAGVPQYGNLVDGVYRTEQGAPLNVCDVTDSEGSYVLTGIRYAENGTRFLVRPAVPKHEFSPAVQPIVLNNGHPVENQVYFTDVSSYTLSGVVQFAGQACYESGVRILVDGKEAGPTDKNGKFAVSTDNGVHSIRALHEDYTYWVVHDGDTTETDSLVFDVDDDISDIVFLNTTRHTVSGKAGGGCDRYVGEITIRFRSEDECLDTTFVQLPEYTIDLPPLVYYASATVDPATIPAGLVKSDVIDFFQQLGERELDLTAAPDTTMDFVYRAPLSVQIVGFEPYATCDQLVLEDGSPLPPNLPVVPQLTHVDLTIQVNEDYGGSTCPLDTGMVVINDELWNREDTPDTLTVSGGVATYRTFAATPSLLVGRTEGGKNRSYQKALTATAVVEGRNTVSATEWVLVTGRVAPAGAEFVTFTADVPLHILRDPPGDGSSAFLERGFKLCAKVGVATSLTLETGVELKTEFGFDASTYAFWGVPKVEGKGLFTLENKFVIGSTVSSDLTTDICLSTKEKFSTSSSADLVGEDGDVFIGTGVNFLFTKAGTINVDNECRVLRGSVVAFEPDSIKTAYAYTETHIRDVLIPELQDKVAYYQGKDEEESFAAQVENWQAMLDLNTDLKNNARTTTNRSFSAGTSYEYTHENEVTAALNASIKLYSSFDNKLGTNAGTNIFGGKASVQFAAIVNIKSEVAVSAGGSGSATLATGYTLVDDDLGDNFTVDIKRDGSFISPVFQVRGGKSSCPYEPWPDLETNEPSMVARDRPQLFVTPAPGIFDVAPDEPAILKISVANQSDETREYVLRSVSVSNPGGAILNVNGSPIHSGLAFTILPESAHEATLTVARGPSNFYYDDLQLVLGPACDSSIEDKVTFDVGFAAACSDIALFLPESGWRYNQADADAGQPLLAILSDYDALVSPRDSLRVVEVGLQVRVLGADGAGPGPWVDVAADSVGPVETYVNWNPPAALADGVYELRAYAECNSGGRNYSAAATGTIDRNAPLVFGTPDPSDGELSLGEDIRVTFNEPVDCRTVTADSVSLTYLDGPAAGAGIPVARSCNGSSVILAPQATQNDLEGRRLRARVWGVRDLAGNAMEAPVGWEFEYRKSLFTWSNTRVSRDLPLGNPGSIDVELANGTAGAVNYALADIPAFLSVDPANATGTIAPGVTRVISLEVESTLTAGVHEGQVTAYATDASGDTTGVARLDLHLAVACSAPQWTVNPANYEYSMSMVGKMTLDGSGLPLNSPADRLAAFVGSELRGLASPAAAGGDTLVFLTVYSNRASGETVRFEVWDDDPCKRYPATLERYPFNADAVLGSPQAPVSFTAIDAPSSLGEFPLAQGWNWFSSSVVSGDMSVVAVLSNLTPEAGDIIKSKTAFATFDPGTPTGWVGSLATIDNASGYMIRLAAPGTILQEGARVDPTLTPVPVASGWNWIAYAGDAPRDVAGALADLGAQGFLGGGEVVKGQRAFAHWDQVWLGDLESLEPGQGYRLFLQSGPLPGSFVYPANTALTPGIAGVVNPVADGAEPPASAQPRSSAEPRWRVQSQRYQYNMNVIAVLRSEGVDRRDDADMVGAFVGDECRGSANLAYVAGIDRYVAFLTVHGDGGDGETVEFRAFDGSSALVYEVAETLPFQPDALHGTLRDPLVLVTGSAHNGVPATFGLAQNHPNPFNPQTTIQFDLPVAAHVELTIYNVRGQEIHRLVDRGYEPGSHRIVWDGTTAGGNTVATGVYFYKLRAGTFTDVKKMVLLK